MILITFLQLIESYFFSLPFQIYLQTETLDGFFHLLYCRAPPSVVNNLHISKWNEDMSGSELLPLLYMLIEASSVRVCLFLFFAVCNVQSTPFFNS